MTIKFGEVSQQVKTVQKALMQLGYELPKYGADGELGLEGWTALEEFARDVGFDLGPNEELDSDDPIDALVDLLCESSAASRRLILPQVHGIECADLRGVSGKYRHGERLWKNIDAIVLHQTGCRMPTSPNGWASLRAQIGIPRVDGRPMIYAINPPTSLMYHANSLNKRSIGIEIEGNFRGIEGDNRTYWKAGGGPHIVLPEQVKAAQAVVDWLCKEAARHGGHIKHIYAHRQASKDRIADPGSAVWEAVGVWARETLKLSDGGPDFKVGSGYRIPKQWCDREEYCDNDYWKR